MNYSTSLPASLKEGEKRLEGGENALSLITSSAQKKKKKKGGGAGTHEGPHFPGRRCRRKGGGPRTLVGEEKGGGKGKPRKIPAAL